MFFGHLRVLFPISMQAAEKRVSEKKKKHILCTYFRWSKGPAPVLLDCCPLAGFAVGFKVTLMMN